MWKEIKLWYYRKFVISEQKALELGLRWYCNVHGDKINYLNCRSIYKDDKYRFYKIEELNHKYNK